MAKDKNDKGAPIFQRSPGQAHRIFGFDGERTDGGKFALGTPRPRFLFLVRFVRAASANAPTTWEKGLQFAVKRFDRPSVTADTQILNQYNKKRVIQTGLKYGPVKIEFHDTSDQMVMQMWHEYASYYFGDFRKVTESDWAYDQTNPDYKNTGNTGFGLTLPNEQINEQTMNSPVGFFSKLECYQFAAGSYTQFDLINPKISAFNPDDMDYSNDQGHGLVMTLEYESILYQNDNKPRSIMDSTASDFIKSLREDRNFVGDVYEPATGQSKSDRSGNTPAATKTIPNPFSAFGAVGNAINQNAGVSSAANNVANALRSSKVVSSVLPSNMSSSLASFGNFNFGNVAAQAIVNKLPANVSSSVKNAVASKLPATFNNVIGQATANRNTSKGVKAANYDIARGEVQQISNGPNNTATSEAYANAMTQNSVVGTLDLPPASSGDDYSDWV